MQSYFLTTKEQKCKYNQATHCSDHDPWKKTKRIHQHNTIFIGNEKEYVIAEALASVTICFNIFNNKIHNKSLLKVVQSE